MLFSMLCWLFCLSTFVPAMIHLPTLVSWSYLAVKIAQLNIVSLMLLCCTCIQGGQKSGVTNSWPQFCQILTALKDNFHCTFIGKLAVKCIFKIPPHLACVATLPCETLMSAKLAINDKLQGSVSSGARVCPLHIISGYATKWFDDVRWQCSCSPAPLKPRQHGALQILYCIVLYCMSCTCSQADAHMGGKGAESNANANVIKSKCMADQVCSVTECSYASAGSNCRNT